MFKLQHNCTPFTYQQSNVQNPTSQASTVHELRTSRVSSWIWKGRGTRDQIVSIHWIIEKAREFKKNIYFCFIDYAKAFDCVDHTKLWKILKEIGVPEHLTCFLRNPYSCQEETVRMDMEQQTGSKLGKEYVKAIHSHSAYLTYMQSTSCEMLGWMKHNLNQDCQEKYQ